MPRPPKFNEETILDASRDLVVRSGPGGLTMTALADLLNAPSGSLYHRFPSRDALAASLWLRSVRRFQAGYLAQLEQTDPLAAALGAAAYVVTWSRANLGDAQLLLLFRSEDLLRDRWPSDLRDENRRLRRRLERAIGRLQSSLEAADAASRHRVTFAVVDVPYAAVRPALVAGRAPPPSTDPLVAETVRHVLTPLIGPGRKE